MWGGVQSLSRTYGFIFVNNPLAKWNPTYTAGYIMGHYTSLKNLKILIFHADGVVLSR